MFKSIGTILVIYTIVNVFSNAAASFESAIVATFSTVESAALVSKDIINSSKP